MDGTRLVVSMRLCLFRGRLKWPTRATANFCDRSFWDWFCWSKFCARLGIWNIAWWYKQTGASWNIGSFCPLSPSWWLGLSILPPGRWRRLFFDCAPKRCWNVVCFHPIQALLHAPNARAAPWCFEPSPILYLDEILPVIIHRYPSWLNWKPKRDT